MSEKDGSVPRLGRFWNPPANPAGWDSIRFRKNHFSILVLFQRNRWCGTPSSKTAIPAAHWTPKSGKAVLQWKAWGTGEPLRFLSFQRAAQKQNSTQSEQPEARFGHAKLFHLKSTLRPVPRWFSMLNFVETRAFPSGLFAWIGASLPRWEKDASSTPFSKLRLLHDSQRLIVPPLFFFIRKHIVGISTDGLS